MIIPFNKPYLAGSELDYIKESVERGHISGNGYFTQKCEQWLEARTGAVRALLTHSCTAALEMAAILADIKPGDEIIMPSFTFVSTANAFVLRQGVPVFVDIRPDTMNINEEKIEEAITSKTRAIVPVHYAGVSCEMDKIMSIAEKYGLIVIEDAAQGIMCTYKNKPLGSIGHLGALSFHETKNIISGEGGALLINEPQFIERAEIIREKGTNRSQFFRGEVDRYTWVDIGSSYLPSDIVAAFLYAQMNAAQRITEKKMQLWRKYWVGLRQLERDGFIELPVIPEKCTHNAHLFYLKTRGLEERNQLINHLNSYGVQSVFHYVPLHSAKAGRAFGRFCGEDIYTTRESERLLRLPLFPDLKEDEVDKINEIIYQFYQKV